MAHELISARVGRQLLCLVKSGCVKRIVACSPHPQANLYAARHELYTPGKLWITGLVIGSVWFGCMAILAFTSRNRAVHQLGPRRWKRLHKSVYWLLPLGLLHAIVLGADFGVNKGPDVTADVDAGCLVTMLLIAGAWLGFLFSGPDGCAGLRACFRATRREGMSEDERRRLAGRQGFEPR